MMDNQATTTPPDYVDVFTPVDATKLNTLLSDFLMFLLGDQGSKAAITEKEKQFMRNCTGEIKYVVNKLAYYQGGQNG